LAALATGSGEAVQTFLEVQAVIQPQESPLHDLAKQYYKNGNNGVNFGRTFIFSQQSGVASYLVKYANELLLAFLLATDQTDVDSKDSDGRTPLLLTAEKGHEGIVKLLLDSGKVDTDFPDKGERTPLSWAAGSGHEAVVKLLLEKGAELETKDKDCREGARGGGEAAAGERR